MKRLVMGGSQSAHAVSKRTLAIMTFNYYVTVLISAMPVDILHGIHAFKANELADRLID